MNRGSFKSYKQVKTWLLARTDNEFFITNTKGNDITVVICRNNKLLTMSQRCAYMSWFTEELAQEYLTFINQ